MSFGSRIWEKLVLTLKMKQRFAGTYQFNFPLVPLKTQNPNMIGQSNFL